MAADQQEIVDLQFALSGRTAPLDYAELLWQGLREALPWLEDDVLAGVHPISGLSSGEVEWYLSRRSRLTLRLARHRTDAAAALGGTRLSLAGHEIALGQPTVRTLAYTPVIYAKFVAMGLAGDAPISEDAFLAACQEEFARRGIQPKAICGKAQRVRTSAGLLSGFSLMLYDLEQEANLQLQYEGLGSERKRGCGIFIPHKSGAALGTLE